MVNYRTNENYSLPSKTVDFKFWKRFYWFLSLLQTFSTIDSFKLQLISLKKYTNT